MQHISDQPTTLDELGFARAAAALAAMIAGVPAEETPLTVGIYGEWGSGKTSMMHMIRQRLDPDERAPGQVVAAWFEAWRYAQQEDALWRALLLCIVAALRSRLLDQDALLRALLAPGEREEQAKTALAQQLGDLEASLYRSVEREAPGELAIDWGSAGKLATRLVIRAGFAFVPGLAALDELVQAAQGEIGKGEDLAGIWDLFHRQRAKIYHEQVRALDQFQQQLRDLVAEWFGERGRRLVIFIDDLDRCLPEQAVGVLEAIKVFLDIPGCVFVLGVDRQIIERGIRVRYKEFALDAEARAAPARTPASSRSPGATTLRRLCRCRSRCRRWPSQPSRSSSRTAWPPPPA